MNFLITYSSWDKDGTGDGREQKNHVSYFGHRAKLLVKL